MQNERSGARRQQQKRNEGEVLSPAEAEVRDRGQTLRRFVRAAAALSDVYGDTAIGDAVGVKRGTVSAWWKGAQMKPETIRRLAEATGLSFEELTRFVYLGGPPPALPANDPARSAVLEGVRRGQQRQLEKDPDRRARQPGRRSRDTEAESG
jgi:transcriptional regulator with XRE-family HTH domain